VTPNTLCKYKSSVTAVFSIFQTFLLSVLILK
jgi:hypothetical protein